MTQTPDDSKQSALLRILRTVSGQTGVYAASLGVIALLQPYLPPEQVAMLATPAGMVGINLISTLIDKVAASPPPNDAEIQAEVERAVRDSQIADALTREQFREDLARLASGLNLRLLKRAIEDGQRQTVQTLVAEYERGHMMLMAELLVIKGELQRLNTGSAVAVETVVLPDVPTDQRVTRRGATPRLFISYAHDDTFAVNQIAQRLNREFSYEVWIDYDSIRGGEKWLEALASGIQSADRVLFMATPAACASPFCRAELEHARRHGKPIIPLKLSATADEMRAAGLLDLQYIDFNTHEATAWDKLLAALPTVLQRDRDLLDPAKRGLHIDYLRSIFTRLGTANLSYLLDAAPREQVNLIDVYVPLKLRVDFRLEVDESGIIDWWLRDVESQSEPAQEGLERQQRPKELNGFAPKGEGWAAWRRRLDQGWAAFRQLHEAAEAAKPEEDREPVRLGEYNWGKLESEAAPALMPHLVITGDPGSGKTTLIRHLALCLAGEMLRALGEKAAVTRDDLDFWPLPAYTPLFIDLRGLIGSAFPQPTDTVTLEKFLGYVEQELLKPFKVGAYLPILENQLRTGGAMLFLDGLDEVPDSDQTERRIQIKTLIGLLKSSYPDCRVVVTSRPYAYQREDWAVNDFGHIELAALDEDRLHELAHKLFAVVERDVEKAQGETKAFQEQMKARNYPPEIRSSPLFFTLLAGIWLLGRDQPADERLPREKSGIYRRCVAMMIARWTYKDADGKSTAALIRLEEGELRRVLEWLAYTIHSCSDGIDGDPLLFKLGDITNVLDELDLYERVDSRALKDALAQRAGVIYAPSPRLFKFAHLSFQEHLAACHLCGSAANFPRSVVALLAGGDLTRWRNVLTLLPGELDGGKLWTLIQALLPARDAAPPAEPEHPAWYSLYYALHWMQTYRQPDDDDYRQLVQRRCVPWLVRLVETGALTAVERAEMGRLLGALGDTRPGVGLRRDGLPDVPDIDWAEAVLPGSYPVGGDEEAYQSLPAQTVELDYPFWLAKYPVTYAQYEAFVASDGYINPDYWTEAGWDWKGDKTHPERYWNDPRWHIANHPVVGVTWFEAVAFTRWLDALYRKHNLWGDLVGTTHASSGALIDPAASAASHDPASSGERTRHASSLRIRLPTEIEWEIAARGQAGLVYSYGDTFDAAKGNADQTGIGRTSAVGIFPDGASPCGALDMSGNVWEWCLTEHQSGSNDINRTEKRVLRGGSWNYFDAFVRAADRNRLNPVDSYGYLGFRCALS